MAIEKQVEEKLLPQNLDAEAGILGSLLIDPQAIIEVMDFLLPGDFYRETHRLIYQAAVDLCASGEPADLITLTDELQRRGKLDEIGGVSYVSSLANQVPTSRHARYYAEIVMHKSTLRQLINAAGQIAGIAYNEPDADDALEQAEKLIFDIGARQRSQSRLRKIDKGLAAAWERLDALQHGDAAAAGVPTGYRDLDSLLGGLRRSDLIIAAGRPGCGKTSLALSLAHNQALAGYGVAVFSQEMSEEQILARLLAMDASVDLHALRTGRLDDEQWQRVMDSMGRLAALPIWIDDTPGLTLAELRSKARRLLLDAPEVSVLYVDHFQLMRGEAGGKGRRDDNRREELSSISRGLKALAKELDLPIVLLSQLSRAVESRDNKRPRKSDLAESGSQEQDADVILFLHVEATYNPETTRQNITDILVDKHRNGPTGDVALYFQAAQTRFLNLDHYADEGTAPPERTFDDIRQQWWTNDGTGE